MWVLQIMMWQSSSCEMDLCVDEPQKLNVQWKKEGKISVNLLDQYTIPG